MPLYKVLMYTYGDDVDFRRSIDHYVVRQEL